MEEKERRELLDNVQNVFNFRTFHFSDTESDEKTISLCRSYLISFFYKIVASGLKEKTFSFYRVQKEDIVEDERIPLSDLIDSAIIDIRHYLVYVRGYKEKPIYSELNKLNDDYIDMKIIPEFNSKKYIREKLNHICSLCSPLEAIFGEAMPTKAEIEFEHFTKRDDQRIYFHPYLFDSYLHLGDALKYMTPVATDEAILAALEKDLFFEKIDRVRIEILNSQYELAKLLKLKDLNKFLSDFEINKLKDFKIFFDEFNEEHAELFGHEELKYGEWRN